MLSKKNIEQIKNTIVKQFSPQAIYLFGSYATGKAKESSDLDLVIVDNKAKDKKYGVNISMSLFPRNYGLDLITITPADLKKRKKTHYRFWKEVLEKGQALYVQS